MKTLYDSLFQTIYYAKESSLLSSVWKPGTSQMTDEAYLAELHTLYMFIRRYNPIRYVWDVREQAFEISVAAQAFASNLFKDHAASYIAIISKDHNKAEENVKEALKTFKTVVADGYTIRYYTDEGEAMEWLLGTPSH